MRTEQAIKVKMCQLNNISKLRQGYEKEEVKYQIKILEWVLKTKKNDIPTLERVINKLIELKTEHETLKHELFDSKYFDLTKVNRLNELSIAIEALESTVKNK